MVKLLQFAKLGRHSNLVVRLLFQTRANSVWSTAEFCVDSLWTVLTYLFVLLSVSDIIIRFWRVGFIASLSLRFWPRDRCSYQISCWVMSHPWTSPRYDVIGMMPLVWCHGVVCHEVAMLWWCHTWVKGKDIFNKRVRRLPENCFNVRNGSTWKLGLIWVCIQASWTDQFILPWTKKKKKKRQPSWWSWSCIMWYRRICSLISLRRIDAWSRASASRVRSRFRSWIKHRDSSISRDSDFMHQQHGSFFFFVQGSSFTYACCYVCTIKYLLEGDALSCWSEASDNVCEKVNVSCAGREPS